MTLKVHGNKILLPVMLSFLFFCSGLRAQTPPMFEKVLVIKKCSMEQVQNALGEAIADISAAYNEIHLDSISIKANGTGDAVNSVLNSFTDAAAKQKDGTTVTVKLHSEKMSYEDAKKNLTSIGCEVTEGQEELNTN